MAADTVCDKHYMTNTTLSTPPTALYNDGTISRVSGGGIFYYKS